MENRKKILFTNLMAATTAIRDENNKPLFKYVNVWNTQIEDTLAEKDKTYPFKYPSAFIELDLGDAATLGLGVRSYPTATIRFHLLHELLNSRGGKMDMNLEATIPSEYVAMAFNKKQAPFCSSLAVLEDRLDFRHNNIYKYILSFRMNFIETKGSILDVDSGAYWSLIQDPELSFGIKYPVYLSSDGSVYKDSDGKKFIFSLNS